MPVWPPSSCPPGQDRPPAESTRQPPAQPCRPHGGHLPDPPDGLGRSGLLRAEGGRGQDQAGGHSVPQASRQQRGVPPAPHRRTQVRAREDNRERLEACVTGSAPGRPALRRSHSRTHQTLGNRVRQRRPGSSRPNRPEIALLTQRGFGRRPSRNRVSHRMSGCSNLQAAHIDGYFTPLGLHPLATRAITIPAHPAHTRRARLRRAAVCQSATMDQVDSATSRVRRTTPTP